MSIKIIIADDHEILREGLKAIITRDSEFIIAAEASNAEEALEKVKTVNADILLLDISMPGRSGLDIIGEVKAINSKIKILVLSMHPEDKYAIPALKMGASGYLTKDTVAEQLVEALKTVYSGIHYITPALTDALAKSLRAHGNFLPHENLSVREFEVLRLLASGKTISQIANELNLNVTTISTFRARILSKMKMKNNAQLILYAVLNNLLE